MPGLFGVNMRLRRSRPPSRSPSRPPSSRYAESPCCRRDAQAPGTRPVSHPWTRRWASIAECCRSSSIRDPGICAPRAITAALVSGSIGQDGGQRKGPSSVSPGPGQDLADPVDSGSPRPSGLAAASASNSPSRSKPRGALPVRLHRRVGLAGESATAVRPTPITCFPSAASPATSAAVPRLDESPSHTRRPREFTSSCSERSSWMQSAW